MLHFRLLCAGYLLFFFNDTATTEIYTLSLHDALPISQGPAGPRSDPGEARQRAQRHDPQVGNDPAADLVAREGPREQPLADGIEQLALPVERFHAASHGSDLAPIFPAPRRNPRDVTDHLSDRDGAPSELPRHEASGEVAAQRLGQESHVDRRPYRVQAARRSDDPRDPRFQVAYPRSEERRVGKECRSRWSPYH